MDFYALLGGLEVDPSAQLPSAFKVDGVDRVIANPHAVSSVKQVADSCVHLQSLGYLVAIGEIRALVSTLFLLVVVVKVTGGPSTASPRVGQIQVAMLCYAQV